MVGMSLAVVARWSLVALGLAVAVSVEGCGAGPGEPTGETSEAVTFANDKAAFDYFLGKGLANFQAAGIVGNLDQESGVDPLAVQSGGPGRGIAQWSVGGRWDTDPNDNATAYASQQGQSVDSLQLQLDFIWYELTTFPNYGLAALQASTDVTSATIAFQNDFEGCGTCDQSTRISYAQNVLSVYGNDMVDGGSSSGADAGPTGPSCTVPGVGTGICILTTDCAAMPGHVSTPGYCPGPANEQCCTGPSNEGGTPTDGGGNPTGDSGSSSGSSSGGSGSSGSSGSSGGSSSGGSSGSSGAGTGGDASSGGGNGDWPSPSGSKGCSTSPGEAGGSSAAFWMAGLAWLVLRLSWRRTRAS
jgi:MYXO-CTERM domain-containing protein